MTNWDYIQPDALLDLQVQRTNQPDEMVYIMYHQVNELLFKMILWEIDQVAENENISTTFFATKLDRISRYFDMLSSSFSVMGEGMEVEQYMEATGGSDWKKYMHPKHQRRIFFSWIMVTG